MLVVRTAPYTAAESALPGFDAVLYYGLTAPAGVPRPIVDRLNKELRTMLAADDFKNRLISVGDDPATSTPEQFAENIKREEGKMGRAGHEARFEDRVARHCEWSQQQRSRKLCGEVVAATFGCNTFSGSPLAPACSGEANPDQLGRGFFCNFVGL